MHPQFHFTHQQLLRNTALLLRVHRIQAVVALRDHGNCKLSCLVPLSVFVYCLRLMVCLPKNVDLISSEANREIGHILCKMQHLIVASMWSNHMIWRKFFCSPCRSERETVAEVIFGSFTMVGSQSTEGNWTSILSEFTCQYSHSCQSCCSSLGYYFCLGLNLAEFFSQVLCTSWILVVGWRCILHNPGINGIIRTEKAELTCTDLLHQHVAFIYLI